MNAMPRDGAERQPRKHPAANSGREPYVKPEPEFEIRIAEGREGEMLAEFQARVLWEVTKWQMAQNNCVNGQDEAA
ncbi:hypothetical protein [Nocardia vaccinii]|uniref:hypothetical protein n=1 Tax=Nocardia vaccinii TaxID=1822 RepID=UPI000B1197B7|nr:hypothetical protein [Nocardia vaccinii]